MEQQEIETLVSENQKLQEQIQIITSENQKLQQKASVLEKKGLIFRLPSGVELIISEADVLQLRTKIICEGLLTGEMKLVNHEDSNARKARELHEILSKEKGMPAGLRTQYYEEILRLYKTDGEIIESNPLPPPPKRPIKD